MLGLNFNPSFSFSIRMKPKTQTFFMNFVLMYVFWCIIVLLHVQHFY